MTLFLAIPIIEIYLLIKVADVINWLPTIALVVLTAVLGASLLRSQGSQTYLRFNQALSEGRVPANEILEGVALLVGGALLLTPGFFTDLIGFICLLPFTRRPIATFIVNRFNPLASTMAGPMSGMNMGGFGQAPPSPSPSDRSSYGASGTPKGNKSNSRQGNVIEGEVTHRSDD
ncbi:MAG: FxsA family protein [Gammaproteobacteria bacterium]